MTAVLSPRVASVLGRFPSHLDLVNPSKTFAAVTSSLAGELDVDTSTVGRIRKNHRVVEVDTVGDLLALVALHDLDADHFAILDRRLAAVGDAGRALSLDPGNAVLAGETRARLMDLVGAGEDVFPPFDGEPDETPSNRRLANALTRVTYSDSEMALRRAQAVSTAEIHRAGNGSVETILRATATMLGLEMTKVLHHVDRYWHFARCVDRVRLVELAAPGSDPERPVRAPLPDLVAVEENPFRPADVSPAPRPHGQLFAITRAGWEDVPVTVRVLGIGERCISPMVVNVDSGQGVAFTGSVPEGSEVRFGTSGVVTLGPTGVPDPTPITRNSFSFSGAVFASAPAHPRDFVWADASDREAGGDRAATFVQTAPITDGFDPSAMFPHQGGLIVPPILLVNTTRWAFFVRAAHFGRRTDAGDETAVPFHLAGIWDRSAFDPTVPDGSRQPSGMVGFDWQEREAFAANVWLPRRFEALDAEGLVPIREHIRILLDRYRGAGIHLRVKDADDQWTLGVGVARDAESLEAMGTIVAGTRLWPTPPEA